MYSIRHCFCFEFSNYQRKKNKQTNSNHLVLVEISQYFEMHDVWRDECWESSSRGKKKILLTHSANNNNNNDDNECGGGDDSDGNEEMWDVIILRFNCEHVKSLLRTI